MNDDSPRRRGRPRAFDRDWALAVAMREFWQRGFEPVSVAELTAAIGITPPSLYAAFGDKKTLFREVVDRYQRTHGAFFAAALDAEPSARAGVARALRAAAVEYTSPGRPAGCLVISAAVNCTTGSADIVTLLREQRAANTTALRDRIEADVSAGTLPAGTDSAGLAALTGAVLQGMSQQARDGMNTTELLAVADAAMRAWPPGEAADG
ncbi:TetR/AcrR family transcriptional regulator [Actinoplanes derwentensis]|uniref:DNA-binding transcriptional regulator, AcrR family n=1 Tax=Actinoplanes derwentensis TaxID=113562 RepID=A0A1H1Z071_9ACTN|nr:TetR/AcrR family transcriptional regulator [Actinoplanes derwentensis]GID81364.1 TetR family transcriptional regulator [Actinoplanes derwentensis]SDT27013.1 DNA-binding transcriptional regulator, AcrR family [Actinoplanes derwentensis]